MEKLCDLLALVRKANTGCILQQCSVYIYYSINEIELAITQKKKVSFYYFDYNEKKEKVFRKDKKRYYINPYAMLISNDNYYLIGYNDFYKNFLHFRIDRMTETRISHYDIVESEEIDEFDLAKHYRQLFGIKNIYNSRNFRYLCFFGAWKIAFSAYG